MRLPDEVMPHILAFVERATGDKCAVCDESQLEVEPWIWGLPTWAGNFGISQAGPSVPVIVATCGACGHLMLFSAIKAGIVPTPDEMADAADRIKKIKEGIIDIGQRST